ncbi:hypothetical protein GHK86_20895, partial [Acidimicrobiaceae bacterium USS-CC1]|nr:hypothetical protein [Acidiferrimicrobium australe]
MVLIAVAFAASHSFEHQTQVTLKPGQTATYQGQHVTYLRMQAVQGPNRHGVAADVLLNGQLLMRPAVNDYPASGESVPTPAIHSTPAHDVYLTLATTPAGNKAVTLGIIVEPLVSWVWIGGLVVVLGSVLAAVPGRRRRLPTRPLTVGAGG